MPTPFAPATSPHVRGVIQRNPQPQLTTPITAPTLPQKKQLDRDEQE
jgi:hypothetical protein